MKKTTRFDSYRLTTCCPCHGLFFIIPRAKRGEMCDPRDKAVIPSEVSSGSPGQILISTTLHTILKDLNSKISEDLDRDFLSALKGRSGRRNEYCDTAESQRKWIPLLLDEHRAIGDVLSIYQGFINQINGIEPGTIMSLLKFHSQRRPNCSPRVENDHLYLTVPPE